MHARGKNIMYKKCSIQHKMYAREWDVQKVLTKCTLESGMCKKCSIQHKMYAREWDVQKVLYTTQMYAREWDVQKVLYTAQNVRSRVGCAKSALYSTKCTLESGMCKSAPYSTKCTLESGMCKKCSIQHKCMLESGMCKKCSIQHKMYAVVIRIIILKEVGLEGGREQLFINNYVHLFHAYNYSSLSDGYTFFEPKTLSDLRICNTHSHAL